MKWFKVQKQGSHEDDVNVQCGSQDLNQIDKNLDNSWEPSHLGIIAELRFVFSGRKISQQNTHFAQKEIFLFIMLYELGAMSPMSCWRVTSLIPDKPKKMIKPFSF